MGQTKAKRIHFNPREEITSLVDANVHTLDFTGYFQIDDIVDIVDVDTDGNILSVIADNVTILSINPDNFVTFDTSVDTSAATGTPMLVGQPIDDVQEAIDRLFRRKIHNPVAFLLKQDILSQELNVPIAGQTTYDIDNASFWRAGDIVDILADEGLISSNVSIVSVNVNADSANNRSTIVVSGAHDTSSFTNPFLLNKTITTQKAILRNQERIDGIDQPKENEYLGIGNSRFTAFETSQTFVQNSSKILLDGRRLRLGTPGTRGSLIQGSGNDQLTFTSMVLGTDGNKTKIAIQSGGGLTVSVTGNFNSGHTITVNNNSGAATSQDIADAINADASARRLVQVRWGGDGTGVVSTFTATALAGGLNNDGDGDYAELEQVFENVISGTGFKWVSLHIRPNERNRLNSPPDDDEELVVDYRKAADNVDY